MADLTGCTVGPYHIEEEIGTSSTATVYKAYRAPLDVYVAVKVLPGDAGRDDDLLWRFLRQARATGRLTHPNIVAVHRVGQDGGFHYVAMDHVAGPSLGQKLKGEGRLSCEAALSILRQVAAALDFSHAEGVLHCNVTPANILLAPGGRAMLTDFTPPEDVSRPRRERGDLLARKAPYMSPEQAEAQALDGRSDLYSLGVVLYEMLTGRVPFEGDATEDVLHKHVAERPAAPSAHNPGIPGAVDKVVLRALSKRKERRYQSGAEMAQALAKAIGAPMTGPGGEYLPLETGAGRARRLLLGIVLGLVAALAVLGALASQQGSAPALAPTVRPSEVPLISEATPTTIRTVAWRPPTVTPRPTRLPPSPTPTPTPTATATPTTPPPTTTSTATRQALPTATPGLVAAPSQAAPSDGSSFGGGAVTFRWSWHRPLQADEYFDVRVWREGAPHYGIAWTREPFLVVSGLESGRYQWAIAVIRATGTQPDGSQGWEAVSEESDSWAFGYWVGGSGGTTSPTSKPPPPPPAT